MTVRDADAAPAEIEADIRRIGGELAAAFPPGARHPLRTLDARAMDLAARDRELRAALFRFVDVVPACRSLDDVARHLGDFLKELPEAPPPIAAAMRISDVRAARARFIVVNERALVEDGFHTRKAQAQSYVDVFPSILGEIFVEAADRADRF